MARLFSLGPDRRAGQGAQAAGSGPRVSIRQGAQADPTVITALIAEEGPFDIIIDDSSHRADDVTALWRLLGQALVPGGIYVVEDVQTAFLTQCGGSADLSAPSHLAALRDLAIDLGAGRPVETAFQGIERHHNLIVLVAADGPAPDLMQATVALRVAAAGQGGRCGRAVAGRACRSSRCLSIV